MYDNTSNTDKSFFLKECIADALFKLMRKKNLAKITINELVSVAGVGRMTYFRNFTTKLDVISFKLKLLSKQYYSSLKEQPKTEEQKRLHFFKYIYQNKELFSLLNKQNAFIILLYFLQDATNNSNNAPEDKYKIPFFVFGTTGIVSTWANDDFKQTPEEIMAMLKKWIILDEKK